jgi:hypothetical protein
MKSYEFRQIPPFEDTHDTVDGYIKYYISFSITIIFILEFLVKLIALGFVLEENTYLRDNWNKLDFLVVVVG